MYCTVKCKHSLPSRSHHLPQPGTISALAAAIMRSSWESNKGLQGELLYTSIIPLGCCGMFFHPTTVCQALVQMENALTCLEPDLSNKKSELSANFNSFFLTLYCITHSVGDSGTGVCSSLDSFSRSPTCNTVMNAGVSE